MLKLSIHAGLLPDRRPENIMATVDIAYAKKEALADYLIAATVRDKGEQKPQTLENYPRWSGSLWDLAARAIARSLYGDSKIPPSDKPDKRCAYATKLCAVIERYTVDERSQLLAQAELWQQGPERTTYAIKLSEDILGEREAQFQYGTKRMETMDLMMRALSWALFKQDTPGPRPKLILPTSVMVGNEDRFDVASLQEPARTGFARHMAATRPTAKPVEWASTKDYVQFLMEG